MPRAGWRKPESDRRLSDLVSVGVLTRVFPPEVVDAVIAEVGRTEQRHRVLTGRVMAYFSIGMALYSEGSYEDVLAGWLAFLRRLLDRVNPARRPRANPRVAKRKYVTWNVTRAHHGAWPHPQHPPMHTKGDTN